MNRLRIAKLYLALIGVGLAGTSQPTKPFLGLRDTVLVASGIVAAILIFKKRQPNMKAVATPTEKILPAARGNPFGAESSCSPRTPVHQASTNPGPRGSGVPIIPGTQATTDQNVTKLSSLGPVPSRRHPVPAEYPPTRSEPPTLEIDENGTTTVYYTGKQCHRGVITVNPTMGTVTGNPSVEVAQIHKGEEAQNPHGSDEWFCVYNESGYRVGKIKKLSESGRIIFELDDDIEIVKHKRTTPTPPSLRAENHTTTARSSLPVMGTQPRRNPHGDAPASMHRIPAGPERALALALAREGFCADTTNASPQDTVLQKLFCLATWRTLQELSGRTFQPSPLPLRDPFPLMWQQISEAQNGQLLHES